MPRNSLQAEVEGASHSQWLRFAMNFLEGIVLQQIASAISRCLILIDTAHDDARCARLHFTGSWVLALRL